MFVSTPTLYAPKPSYRIFGGYQKDPTPGFGQNPLPGVTIDYYLPELDDSVEVKMKVLEGDEVIRSYSSIEDENFKTWTGGPSKPQVLPCETGINRFNWDLNREGLSAVEGVFTYGDFSGSSVAPGEYRLRLVVAEDSMEVPVTVLPDPNVESTMAEFDEQQAFLAEIEGLISNIHGSVNVMRSAKRQLRAYQELLEGMQDADVLLDTAKSLIEKIDQWEQDLIQPKQKTFQDVINFGNQLNAELMNLRSYVDQPDPEVTTGAKERWTDLKAEWQTYQDRLDQLIDVELATFNDLYREASYPAVILKE